VLFSYLVPGDSKCIGCDVTSSSACIHRAINRSALAANRCCYGVCRPWRKIFDDL